MHLVLPCMGDVAQRKKVPPAMKQEGSDPKKLDLKA